MALLRVLVLSLLMAPVMACGGSSPETGAAETPPAYEIDYRVTPDPGDATVAVELDLRQRSHLLREVRFRTPGNRFTDFEGDGEITRDGNLLTWRPPATGGTLRWEAAVLHRRNGNGYDAWLGESWGLFRAEDIIPSAATRTAPRKGRTASPGSHSTCPPTGRP